MWMLPTDNAFGPWPQSGEIDIVESRGNDNFSCDGKTNDNTLVESTLHFGTLNFKIINHHSCITIVPILFYTQDQTGIITYGDSLILKSMLWL